MDKPAGININKLYFTEKLKKELSAILEKPITIIEAPMGYGKTVAVREFLQGREADVLWIPLSSCPKMGYWELFCRVLEEQYPEEAKTAFKLRSMGFPEAEKQIYQVLDILKSYEFDRPTVIVVDDYQLVNHQRMSCLVEAMVQSDCKNLHGVLISRNRYCGNSEILSLKGYLKVIDRSRFVFSEEDIRAYYLECGIMLSDEDIKTLYRVTEGWISALFLYLLRYEKEGSIVFPTNLYEIMDKELFSKYTDEMKDLLFAVTPFKDFNYSQAEFVWGRDDLHDLLSELRTKNAFVLYGDRTKQFYIHSIFLKFLKQNMNRLPKDRRRNYYTRCGDWFFGEKDYYRAITCYYEVGDYRRILSAIEKECDGEITHDKWDFYKKVLKNCPDEVMQENMRAVFLIAIITLLINDEEFYREIKKWLEGYCAGIPSGGALEYMQAFECYNDIAEMGKHFSRSAQMLGEKAAFFGVNAPNWTMGSPSILFMFHRRSGAALKELEQMKENIHIYAALSKGHGMGSAQMMEAEYYLNRGNIEQAEVAAYLAQAVARKYCQDSIIFCGFLIQLRCALLKGDAEIFGRLLENMEQEARMDKSCDSFLWKQLELSRGFLYAVMGRESEIPLWVRREDNYRHRIYRFAYPVYQVILGRYLLSEGKYSRVTGVFQSLLQDPLYNHHALLLIYSYLYIAIAQDKLGWESHAHCALEKAFELALPDELYLPIAENYSGLQPLLERLPPGCSQQDIGRIKALAVMLEEGKKSISGKKRAGTGLLSAREKSMARLACTSRTYAEIAEELFLAKSTVKRSMVVIFKKLGIHSREELLKHRDKFEE